VLFYFWGMRKWLQIDFVDSQLFVNKLVSYSSKWEHFLLLNSCKNRTTSPNYACFDVLAACGSVKIIGHDGQFDSLKKIINHHNDWIFGHLNYDLKNHIENLFSNNNDSIGFPDFFFFIPRYVIKATGPLIEIGYLSNENTTADVKKVVQDILGQNITDEKEVTGIQNISHSFSKEEYLKKVEKIKQHILLGDVYELNFCTEFLAKNIELKPAITYKKLNELSPAPFSGYYRLRDKYLISSSPERFLAKRGTKLISQPIKGTIKRGRSEIEDNFFKNKLKNDEKERAENIMITDLVRNDLSRTAKTGSVKVEELCEIYSYEYVHQMISTVVSELDEEHFDIVDVIKNAFPMGSMTGAPKIRAMRLIEKYEKSKRGLYSGCIGYISPEKDFDFNVVIRSILYNSTNKNLSFSVGSAITFKSIAEKEYEECLLKAEAMKSVLK
jgi:para-aminobenzoate synthetase component I